jgi:hypothetical protein
MFVGKSWCISPRNPRVATRTLEGFVIAMTCNIDAKGRAVRLIIGLVSLLAGVLMLGLWAWRAGGWLAWAASIAVLIYGAFATFEGWAGWCVVRAMGFKTRF